MSQTTMPTSQDPTLTAGDLAEMTPHQAESLQVATAAITPGKMCEYNGTAGQMTVLTGAADVDLAGILLRSHAHVPGIDLDTNGDLKVGVVGSVLRDGVVAVFSEQAVNPSATVRARHTTNGASLAGNFRTAAVVGETFNISSFARWRSTTTGAGVALLEIDMTNSSGATAD